MLGHLHPGQGERHKGLLQAAEQQGRHHRYPKIALNVAQENEQALSLYQRLQYVITHETFLYHHPHVRLVKRLANGQKEMTEDVHKEHVYFPKTRYK